MVSPVNNAAFQAAETQFKSLAAESLLLQDARYQEITDESTTNSKFTDVGGYLNYPQMAEWIGQRDIEALKAFVQTHEVTSYQKTIPVDLKDLLGDPTGELDRSVAGFLAQTQSDKLKLVSDKLLAATSDLCYDGTPMAGASHPLGPDGTTQSNIGTTALDVVSFNSARVQMAQLQDNSGAPLDINLDRVMVGPALYKKAQELFGPAMRTQVVDNDGGLDGGGTAVGGVLIDNIYSDVQWIRNPYFKGAHANKWVAWDSSKQSKPIIMRVLSDMEPVSTLDTPGLKMTTEVLFGVDFHASIGYGDWRNLFFGNVAA